ncbi:hypothetical protein B0A55_10394 [Friedmanniomyces simplex]|uniref:Dol-P-Glc:Glc(2)Man(9)GlcNAc(2)-PP-Dol alpha-1,2-glucosyltransferase n=1 Tax=Friedmanniomyces simplex TaxID=329884 RepID=A0A4U0WN86_9PEZI|nr:hypothetical protein B0A55_10394 [Friedmanniomyces simplex]
MAAAVGALLVPLSTWFFSVNSTVTEPYLDEVFHVRQAQQYCQGRFDVWDPKITTPPGLYLLSYVSSRLESLQQRVGLGHRLLALDCSLTGLRALNAVGLLLLFIAIRFSYLQRASPAASAHPDEYGYWTRTTGLIALGLASLAFRQTNIFWITAFPAGLVLVRELDRGHPAVRGSMHRKTEGFGDSVYSIAKTSWKMGVIYDPPVRDAWIDVATQPKRLVSLLVTLTPYLILSAAFAAFIFWNGSVVLGDKSNHTATLHLPQMLYLWPSIAFFSWPLLYPYILLTPVVLLAWLPLFGALEAAQIFKRSRLLPRLSLALLAVSTVCAVIWGNTIVHPFTLADNRHYVFYAFKRLLRPWWLRYALSPVYILCGWACIQVLGAEPAETQLFARNPSGLARKLPVPNGQHSARLSFALVLIATSAMQLITAPLVEPRYFILPWIFWRLHVPLRIPIWKSPEGNSGWSWRTLWEEYDHRLWVETAWLLAVNAVTGYIFLYWGFGWPQEPGRVQRFIW